MWKRATESPRRDSASPGLGFTSVTTDLMNILQCPTFESFGSLKQLQISKKDYEGSYMRGEKFARRRSVCKLIHCSPFSAWLMKFSAAACPLIMVRSFYVLANSVNIFCSRMNFRAAFHAVCILSTGAVKYAEDRLVGTQHAQVRLLSPGSRVQYINAHACCLVHAA